MTFATPEPIRSGVRHRVLSVAGHVPTGLEDFVGETEFCIGEQLPPYVVRGCGTALRDQVRFHEKEDVDGKDARVWAVTRDNDGFDAVHVAAF